MRLSRRTFLVSSLSLTGLGVAGGAVPATLASSDDSLVITIIKRHLTLGGISEADLRDFARAFMVMPRNVIQRKRTLFRLLSPFAYDNETLRNLLPQFVRERLERYEREVFTQFILSTDLLNERRENKDRIRYLGYYNPLSTPCANPLTEV